MKTKTMKAANLKPHPANYNDHPDDQVAEIAESLKQHGQYKNIVVSKDGYVLAGHGVREGALKAGIDMIRVVQVEYDHDHPSAMKILAADNTLSLFAMSNDRALSEILKSIREDHPEGLLGTGFDDMKLANLVMVTRPVSEISDMDEAAEWIGMPDFEPAKQHPKLVLNFDDEKQRRKFCEQHKIETGSDDRRTWSTWWPQRDKNDLKSVRYE